MIEDYFDDSARSANGTSSTPIRDINGPNRNRRINFWQYMPAKSKEPYLYFDTSRHPASTRPVEPSRFDPPRPRRPSGPKLHVHALKKKADRTAPTCLLIQFVDPNKFQVLHCGIDDAWGTDAFEQMSIHGLTEQR